MSHSLSKLVYEKAKIYASLEALRVDGKSITYEELNARALMVASALIECGARSETIGIVGQRKLSSYVGLLGIIYAGCRYTPINPKYSQDRLLAMLKDAKIRFLVGDRRDLEQLTPALEYGEYASSIEGIILPEGHAPEGKNWWDENSFKLIAPLVIPVDVGPEDLCYLLYTSGSTGRPKGVQVSHFNVLAFLRGMAEIYKLRPGFRASQTFDFSFDPSVSDMFFTWTQGGVLCVLPDEEILLPHEYIRREKITFWNSVPSIANFMNKMGHLRPGSFPDLSHSMFCGEQFPKQLADAWQKAAPNSTVENLYGPTEATIYISHHVYTEKERDRNFKNSIIPIGRPFYGHEFAIIDESNQRVLGQATGEIVFKGPQITKGYLNDQAKTDAVFVKFAWDPSNDIWYKSGDLGFYNDDNNLECIGRKDSQIKLGGRRIEIGEIEGVLGRYPATQDAVVVPLRDENKVVIGCVAFTMNKIDQQIQMSIRQESAKFLEQVFFPKKIITIDFFPLSPSGKKDRKALELLASQIMGAKS